jgi:hypothetical protein
MVAIVLGAHHNSARRTADPFMTSSIRRLALCGAVLVAFVTTIPGHLGAQSTAPVAAGAVFSEDDARRWLTYLSSDLLQGRQVFTEGYGLASSYIAGELRAMGVEGLGEDNSYFQPIVRRGYRVSHRSTVTVTARGETRTFAHGDHVTVPASAGGRQTLRLRGAEFIG